MPKLLDRFHNQLKSKEKNSLKLRVKYYMTVIAYQKKTNF